MSGRTVTGTSAGRVTSRLDRLYAPYLRKNRAFVRGGVVDGERYAKAPVKLLWLLREPPHASGGLEEWLARRVARHERRDLSYSARPRFRSPKHNKKESDDRGLRLSANLGGLTYAALHRGAPFEECFSDRGIAEGLRSLAATTLVKSAGRVPVDKEGKVDRGVLNRLLKKTRKLWEEEIRLIAPDYVVCAGNSLEVVWALGNGSRIVEGRIPVRNRSGLEDFQYKGRTWLGFTSVASSWFTFRETFAYFREFFP